MRLPSSGVASIDVAVCERESIRLVRFIRLDQIHELDVLMYISIFKYIEIALCRCCT